MAGSSGSGFAQVHCGHGRSWAHEANDAGSKSLMFLNRPTVCGLINGNFRRVHWDHSKSICYGSNIVLCHILISYFYNDNNWHVNLLQTLKIWASLLLSTGRQSIVGSPPGYQRSGSVKWWSASRPWLDWVWVSTPRCAPWMFEKGTWK